MMRPAKAVLPVGGRRVVFDSHHPKHYLTVRALAQRCAENGIEPIWTARDKDVLVDLMRQDGLDPFVLTTARNGLLGKLGELVVYDCKLARLVRRLRPQALMGKAISLAHVGRLLGVPSLLINDDSAAANPQYRYLGYPFATRIISAECMAEDYGKRQRTYPGMMELAYLHPKVFSPDAAIREELGVAPKTALFVIRLASFQAYHDVGQSGLSQAVVRQLVDRLAARGRVYIVAEGGLDEALAGYRMPLPASRLHHLLAACDLVIGDGLTVVVEAALLGVPAIACGSYIGKHAYTGELEERFGLMFGYKPERFAAMLEHVDRILSDGAAKAKWSARRGAMLSAWDDPTDIYWEELTRVMAERSRSPSPVPAQRSTGAVR